MRFIRRYTSKVSCKVPKVSCEVPPIVTDLDVYMRKSIDLMKNLRFKVVLILVMANL